jgi:hypothetical protein
MDCKHQTQTANSAPGDPVGGLTRGRVPPKETDKMAIKDVGMVLGILAIWFVLARWVFPFFGIPTCMSGACSVDNRPAATDEMPEQTEQGGDSQ